MFEIFRQIGRYFSFANLRTALGIERAADRQFTSSVAGMSDAYDIEGERQIKEFNELKEVLAEVDAATEQMRGRLKTTTKERIEAEKALNGSLAAYERAKAERERAQIEADGAHFQAEITKLTEEEAQIKEDIALEEQRLGPLEAQLSTMMETIRRLPSRKAENISRFVSAKALTAAEEKRMKILSRTTESSPLDAVERAVEAAEAKARVTSRVAGAATTDRRAKYLATGAEEDAKDGFQRLLAARKTERAAVTGEAPKKELEDDRPHIVKP